MQVLSNLVPHSDMGHMMWEPRGRTEGLGAADKTPHDFTELSILKPRQVKPHFKIFYFKLNNHFSQYPSSYLFGPSMFQSPQPIQRSLH